MALKFTDTKTAEEVYDEIKKWKAEKVLIKQRHITNLLR